MAMAQKIKMLIKDFIDSRTVQAVEDFADMPLAAPETVNLIAKMFGYEGDFSSLVRGGEEQRLLTSFKHNLTLLIQKTWVEKSDIALKEQILYQLESFYSGTDVCGLFRHHFKRSLSYVRTADKIRRFYRVFLADRPRIRDFLELCTKSSGRRRLERRKMPRCSPFRNVFSCQLLNDFCLRPFQAGRFRLFRTDRLHEYESGRQGLHSAFVKIC